MLQREATVAASAGLHARPAAEFVQAAKQAGKDIKISKEGKDPVPANSILSVLSLGAKQGDVVTLQSDDDDAAAALDSLVELLEKGD